MDLKVTIAQLECEFRFLRLSTPLKPDLSGKTCSIARDFEPARSVGNGEPGDAESPNSVVTDTDGPKIYPIPVSTERLELCGYIETQHWKLPIDFGTGGMSRF